MSEQLSIAGKGLQTFMQSDFLDRTQVTAKASFVHRLFTAVAPRYDLMNRLMTGGRDRAWRRYVATLASLPTEGLALDVGTGTGDLALALGERYPTARVIGLDFCPAMLQRGREKIAAASMDGRLVLTTGDALHLPFPADTFHAVVSAFLLRNVADISRCFQEMQRVTRPGGRVVCLEIAHPTWPGFRQLFHFYFYRLVPLLGKLLGSWGPGYTYLPHSLTHFPPPEELQTMLEAAGLVEVGYRLLMLGSVVVLWGSKG